MSDGMGRELAYLSSHATNRYFIPNWGNYCGCRHNQPSECVREELGGEWEYIIKTTEAEILT